MDKTDVLKVLNRKFKDLEFARKGRVFLLEMQHITILFEISFSQWSRTYKIDVGIWFKELKDEKSKMSVNSCHLTHNLLNVLMKLGEKQIEIEPLFNFDNSDLNKVESQVDVVFSLISKKVLPYLKKFDDYVYMEKHFENDILLNPFFILFHGIDFYISFLRKRLPRLVSKNHYEYWVYKGPNKKAAGNIAFAKYGLDVEAINILSLTVICPG